MSRMNLVDVIRQQVRQMLDNVYTSAPAIVQSYDSQTQTCTVRLAVNERINKNISIPAPILYEIPVVFPYGGNFRQSWALQKGDNVLLMYSMHPVDEYRASKGARPIDTDSIRKHSLSDAFAFAGAFADTPRRDDKYPDSAVIADELTYVVFNPTDDVGFFIETDKGIKIEAQGNVQIVAPKMTLIGDLEVTGKVSATEEISTLMDFVTPTNTFKNHTHPFINADGAPSTTQPPTP